MLKIGLTGGIASGKSTVAREFLRLGVPVMDADTIARSLTLPGTEGLERLVRELGPDILDAAGGLDRPRLRQRLFTNAGLRRRVEALLHPLILGEMRRALGRMQAPYAVAVIPLLAEVPAARSLVDRVLVVDAPEDLQLRRLMSRDGESEAAARRILAAQANRVERAALQDDMLVNTGSRRDLRSAVQRLHSFYLELAANPEQPHPGLRLP